jgi:hypothetical protein
MSLKQVIGAAVLGALLMIGVGQREAAAQYYVWMFCPQPVAGCELLYQSIYGGDTLGGMIYNAQFMPSWFTWDYNGSALDFADFGYAIAYNYFLFGDTNGRWGYYVSINQRDASPGEGIGVGDPIDDALLPAGFKNGDILTGYQLNIAMGMADFCGSCGDVPPAPEDEPASTVQVSDGWDDGYPL